MIDGEHLVRLQLRVTSRDDNERLRVLAANASDQLATLFVGKLRHGASVHHADVSLFPGARTPDAMVGQFAADGGRFGEIELATQRVVGRLFIFKISTINHLWSPLF